jgi:excisionase family DNA binding protein
MEKRLLRVEEVAEFLKVSVNTIYGWVYQKRIPHKKIGRLLRFDEKEIEKWVEENSVEVYDSLWKD